MTVPINSFAVSGTGVIVGAGLSAGAPDVVLFRDSANTLALRNGANAQKYSVYSAFTDASNYSRGVLDFSSTANVFLVGSESAGTGTAGTLRLVSASGIVEVTGGQRFGWTSATLLRGDTTIGDGNLRITNNAGTDFGLLKLGGTTSSFPALKRSSAVLQARLADDSAFAALQGLLRTGVNAVTGLTPGVLAATTNATIVITDASGQDYRVPCII